MGNPGSGGNDAVIFHTGTAMLVIGFVLLSIGGSGARALTLEQCALEKAEGTLALLKCLRGTKVEHVQPDPPQLPENFVGWGRYLVPDLDVDVPFSWQARNGDVHMIAGSSDPRDPIHFENIIHTDASGSTDLYTVTYKWPEPIPNPGKCSMIRIGDQHIDLAAVNQFFATSSYAGREQIFDKWRPVRVDHFRATLVIPVSIPELPPYPFIFRFPVLSADLYVDPRDPRIFRQVLHFGLQNLYDEHLDEWFTLTTFQRRPGQVKFPVECENATVKESILDLGSVQ